MRLENVKREVTSSGTMEVSIATIAPSKKVFDMFSDQTYANKPLAIMRELVANGIDAHKSAGRADRPVEVVLPTPLEPACRIRDFGTGMPHSFVMNEFMQYTNGSTKDDNDDAIGGFGIGSKSPFAYVDQYSLRVVHEGVLSVYTMFKNTDGIPAVGLQGQTTTDEPNGVEVSFPVEDADMQTFADAAQEALQYFMPMPLVTNGTLKSPDYTYTGNGWALRPKAGPIGVIMGGVRYPTISTSFGWDLRNDKKLSALLDYGIDLTLPIGSCGVAMSREQLSYVDKTTTSVHEALRGLLDDIVATFANFFDHCPSRWDAMKLLAEETGLDSYNRSGRAQLLLGNAKYKGTKLETSFRITPEMLTFAKMSNLDVKAWRIMPASNRRSSSCPSSKWETLVDMYGITPAKIESLIIDDLPESPKSKAMQKIKAYINDQLQAKETLVIRGSKVATILAMLNNPTDYVLTSTLPEPPAAAAKKAKSIRPRVRMFTFTGGKDKYTHTPIGNLTPARSKEDAVREVKYADQPASGTMVVMQNFDLPSDFTRKMETQLIRYDELVFVNGADAPKLKDAFKTFDDLFATRLKYELARYADLPARIALSKDSDLRGFIRTFQQIDSDKRYDALPVAAKSRPFGRLMDAWRTYVKPLDDRQTRLAPFVTASTPSGLKPEALAKAFRTKQPNAAILMGTLDLSDGDHRDLFFRNL